MDINSLMDLFIAQIGVLLVVCGAVERISQLAKLTLTQYTKQEMTPVAKEVITIVISIIFCLLTGVKFDIGVAVPVYVNQIIAGLLISFGSGTLHAVLSFIQSIKGINEAKADTIKTNTIPSEFDNPDIKG